MRRAIERLRSDSDADVSLAALASDAGLSRFHFCRAFKESTGLSPHVWLRQHRLERWLDRQRAGAIRGPIAIDGMGPTEGWQSYWKDVDARRRSGSSWAAKTIPPLVA